MKALSVGLVKGSIDEVDKKVHMTWVQPRVLDLQQVASPHALPHRFCFRTIPKNFMVENSIGCWQCVSFV